MKLSMRTVYIVLFSILYFCVGLVSTIHSVAFFSLANTTALGILLACTFEIGQASVLFSILTDKSKKFKLMPWCLMTVLTAVQILGNVFSSYKYLMENSSSLLRYFKEPIFVWTTIPDDMANVILTYIIGAILPIVALCMTGMLEQYLNKEVDTSEIDKNINSIDNTEIDNANKRLPIEDIRNNIKTSENKKEDNSSEVQENAINLTKETIEKFETIEPTTEEVTTTEEPIVTTTEEPIVTTTEEPIVTTTEEPIVTTENPLDFENDRQSHFINI